jgi:hypothetical protein
MEPLILQAAPTYNGMEYSLKPWADAFKAQTWGNKSAFMVDNSDGPLTGGNLHYLHLIRAQDIAAEWQTVRFPAMWDTLELSWLRIAEHAHDIGADFVFSCEADVVPPPDAMQLMYDAAMEHAVGGKPAVVSQRYHPRGQEGPNFWWDTLGCCLFPTKGLYDVRQFISGIFELHVFLLLGKLGYPRYRPGKAGHGPDLFIPDHLIDPNDPSGKSTAGTPAVNRYENRVIEGNKQRQKTDEDEASEPSYSSETQEEAATRNPTRTPPMETSEPVATFPFKLSDAKLDVQHGEAPHVVVKAEAQALLDAKPVTVDDDEPDLAKAYPFNACNPSEEMTKKLLAQDRIRLNLGSDMTQLAGFLSVDFNPKVDPDILTDVKDLSMIETGTVDEILALHVLEHLTWDDGMIALKEWLRVLKPMGMLTVAVPEVAEVYAAMRHGARWGEYNMQMDDTYLQATIFGANLLADKIPEMKEMYGGPGHKHQSFYMDGMLLNRVLDAGFVMGHEVAGFFLRSSAMGERMVQAFKPDQKYYDTFLKGE